MNLNERDTCIDCLLKGWLKKQECELNLNICLDIQALIFCYSNFRLEWNQYQSQTKIHTPIITNNGQTATIKPTFIASTQTYNGKWDDAIFLTNLIMDTTHTYAYASAVQTTYHYNTKDSYMGDTQDTVMINKELQDSGSRKPLQQMKYGILTGAANQQHCLTVMITSEDEWKPGWMEIGLQDVTDKNNLNMNGCEYSTGNYSWKIAYDRATMCANKNVVSFVSELGCDSHLMTNGCIIILCYDYCKNTLKFDLKTKIDKSNGGENINKDIIVLDITTDIIVLDESENEDDDDDCNEEDNYDEYELVKKWRMYAPTARWSSATIPNINRINNIPPSKYKWYLRLTCQPANKTNTVVKILNDA